MSKDTDEPKTTTQLHEGPGGAQVPTTAVVGMPSAAAAAGTTPAPSPPGTPVVGHPVLAQAPTPQQVTPTVSTTDLPMSALTGHDPGARPGVEPDPEDLDKERDVTLHMTGGTEIKARLTEREISELRAGWNKSQLVDFRGASGRGRVSLVPADVVAVEVEG